MTARIAAAWALIAICLLVAAALLVRRAARKRRDGRSTFRIFFDE